jgi:hypothetical protein
LGSSRALFPRAEAIKEVKIRSATANLISIMKLALGAGVNAQQTVLTGIRPAMELT